MPEIAADAIDRLITVEMRTRGVPRGVIPALYAGVRARAAMPLVLAAARLLRDAVGPGDRVVLATGAGHPLLLPRGETDGPLGAAALALLLGNDEVLHDELVEARMREAAVGAGAADGIASRLARTVDGQPAAVHAALVTMLRSIVRNALRSAEFTLEPDPQQGGGPPSSASPTSSTI